MLVPCPECGKNYDDSTVRDGETIYCPNKPGNGKRAFSSNPHDGGQVSAIDEHVTATAYARRGRPPVTPLVRPARVLLGRDAATDA